MTKWTDEDLVLITGMKRADMTEPSQAAKMKAHELADVEDKRRRLCSFQTHRHEIREDRLGQPIVYTNCDKPERQILFTIPIYNLTRRIA